MRTDLVLIASADKNWGLGKDNKLLKRIPEDLKRFSDFTRNNLIIVGRKTLESFRNKKPLSDRLNVVLTRDKSYSCEGAVIVNNLDELSSVIENYGGIVYVCGGASLYQQLLPYCQKALITKMDEAFQADTYLTNLDEAEGWVKSFEDEWQISSNGIRFRYVDYIRSE